MIASQPEEWLKFSQSQVSERSDRDEVSSETPFFKVSPLQRQANPKAFDPIAFAFGPYHANFSVSSDANYFKLQAVKRLLGPQRFETLVSRIQLKEPSIRALYVEARDRLAKVNARTFSCLLALDAVTVVAAFFIPKVFPSTILDAIGQDVLLLENQIPIIVLEYAMESIFTMETITELWQLLFCRIVRFYGFWDPSDASWTQFTTKDSSQSLLSLIYDDLTAAALEPCSNTGDPKLSVRSPDDFLTTTPLPTASHLRRCGIEFRACDGSFTAITFDDRKGILSLPRIKIGGDTERFLLNLISYETASRSWESAPVLSYVCIMDCLVDNEEDVKVLVDCGVIRHYLGGSRTELADMWNRLAVQIPIRLTQADMRVMADVSRLSKMRRRKWMATFKERYWEKEPWLLVSLAATLLLVMSILQTLFTIMHYFH